MKYNGKISLKDYEILLNIFKRKGYKTVKYDSVEKKSKHLILRHDIDILPEDTIDVCDIEKKIGYKAYYFFMSNSEIYNLNSPKLKAIINYLCKSGHEIGLHFNSNKKFKNKETLDNHVNLECKIMEHILNIKINIVSFHRPINNLLNYKYRVAKKLHTYMPQFFSNIGYCSDSRGEWRFGDPTKQKEFMEETAIQLLTHAEWWNGRKDLGLNDKIKKIIKKLEKNNLVYLKNNLTNFSIKKVLKNRN